MAKEIDRQDKLGRLEHQLQVERSRNQILIGEAKINEFHVGLLNNSIDAWRAEARNRTVDMVGLNNDILRLEDTLANAGASEK